VGREDVDATVTRIDSDGEGGCGEGQAGCNG
jgi:hypothetical protein